MNEDMYTEPDREEISRAMLLNFRVSNIYVLGLLSFLFD